MATPKHYVLRWTEEFKGFPPGYLHELQKELQQWLADKSDKESALLLPPGWVLEEIEADAVITVEVPSDPS